MDILSKANDTHEVFEKSMEVDEQDLINPLLGLLRTGLSGLYASARIENVYKNVKLANEAYSKLKRSHIDRRKLLEIKFMMQKWRIDIKTKLVESLLSSECVDKAFCLKALSEINIPLSKRELKDIGYLKKQSIQDQSLQIQLSELLALQGFDGPQKKINVKPIKPSKWSFKKWSRIKDFSRYQVLNNRVFYRGVNFSPGDLLVTNLNVDSNGLFTATNSPESFASHLGVFVILESDGRRFPAIIEIHRNGLRALPLSVFLSDEFTSYVEVYRLRNISDQHFSKINDFSKELLSNIYGYSYYTDKSHPQYLNCTGVFSAILDHLRIERVEPKSFYTHPMINSNMADLGFFCRYVLTPVDFVVDPRIEFIGTIDNGHFYLEATRFIAVYDLLSYFSVFRINFKALPFIYHLDKWAIDHVRKENILGKAILYFNGFNKHNFPKGPTKLISMIEMVSGYLRKVVRKIHWEAQDILTAHQGVFEIYAFLESGIHKNIVESHNAPMRRYFLDESGYKSQRK